MPKRSAGILMYRQPLAGIELLLVHPGGPLWARKDWGAWSIPKGEYAEDEDPLTVAKREFEEETGARPEGDFLGLGNVVLVILTIGAKVLALRVKPPSLVAGGEG